MRGNPFALSDGQARHFCLESKLMNNVLSVFVDESGVLSKGDPTSRFYIISLVIHNQSLDISDLARKLDRELESIGIANLCFHAGPIIHAHDEFRCMTWDLRRKIFYRMLAFANHAPFRYACLVVDKKYLDNTDSIIGSLERQLADLIDTHHLDLSAFKLIKIYYDCGQKPVTNLLHRFFESRSHLQVEFAQAVLTSKYKLLQIADLVCTIKLMETRLGLDLPLSHSETKFFGGVRSFKHNVLRIIKKKAI